MNEDRVLLAGVVRTAYRRWRRARAREVLRSILVGPLKCPECGHPMMANWYGLRSGRGPACGQCGFTPYVPLIVACDCRRGIVAEEQPELSTLGTSLTRFVSAGSCCPHCQHEIAMEKARTRWFVLPLPAAMVG